jgi:hypothetical protein
MDIPRLLVMRIWTSPARFRAVVREVETGHIEYFADPDALLGFMLREPSPAPAPWLPRPENGRE